MKMNVKTKFCLETDSLSDDFGIKILFFFYFY
jgi:hypothetical protein